MIHLFAIIIFPLAGFFACFVLATSPALAQSTFASLLGTVKDASGGVVAQCVVTIENTGTSAHRSTLTDSGGSYTVPNLEPGVYTIKMEAAGFQAANYKTELTARQTVRVDGQMTVAAQSQSVNVIAEAAPVINTEV